MSEPDSQRLHAVVASLAGVIGHDQFPRGDLAELRRLRLEMPPAAYWRLLFDRVPEAWRKSGRMERAWAMVISGMAVMAPDCHSPKAPLGRVLARIGGGTAESRLWTLLRSRDEQLEDHLRLVVRFLASKEERVDWTGLARLLFAADEASRDAVCRQLARGFYMTESPAQPEAAAE